MINALKRKVMVKPGGVIEIRSTELVPGTVAEVIVIPEAGNDEQSMLRIIGTGKGSYASPEEAVEYIRKERDSWDY